MEKTLRHQLSLQDSLKHDLENALIEIETLKAGRGAFSEQIIVSSSTTNRQSLLIHHFTLLPCFIFRMKKKSVVKQLKSISKNASKILFVSAPIETTCKNP